MTTGPRFSAAGESAITDSTSGLSSVCLLYRDELRKASAALAADSTDQEAREGATLYQARFADACQ